MDDLQRKALQERIAKEKDSQKLKEPISRAKKEKLAMSQKEAEQQKKAETPAAESIEYIADNKQKYFSYSF